MGYLPMLKIMHYLQRKLLIVQLWNEDQSIIIVCNKNLFNRVIYITINFFIHRVYLQI